MNSFIEALTGVVIVFIALWLLRRLLRPKAPAEPAEDPFSFVPATRRTGPKGKSGAVALEEPEEDPTDLLPPHSL